MNFVVLKTSLSTKSFNFVKSSGIVFNSSFKSSAFIFKLFKLVVTLTSLLVSSPSTSAFKSIKYF